MKYAEYIDSMMFASLVNCPLLCNLLGDRYLFKQEGDYLNFGWAIKGDSYIGEDEIEIHYSSALPHSIKSNDNFDFCEYIISILKKHAECGLIDGDAWREGLRFYSYEDNQNFSPEPIYEECLEASEINEIINILECNRDAINNSIEEFVILEYHFSGEYDESRLETLALVDNQYIREAFEDCEINDLMELESFNDEVIMDEYHIDELKEFFFEKYIPIE